MFSGVGCGIMINGEIYTGARGYAGEISIYNFMEQDSLKCQMDQGCFMKRWEMDIGILDDARSMLNRDKIAAEKFFQLTSSNINNVDLKSVFIANRANDPIARSALNLAAKRLGMKIAFLVNLLNPEVVIIGGGLEDAGEEFLSTVNSTVKEWSFRETTEGLGIVYSELRENAVAQGAASLVMQKVFAQLL
jgi:predicted NBD/HSP70 family sugar kinase